MQELHRRAVCCGRRHCMRRLPGRNVHRGSGGVFGVLLKLQRGLGLQSRQGDVEDCLPKLLGGLGVWRGGLCMHRLRRRHLQRGATAIHLHPMRRGQVFDSLWDGHGPHLRRPGQSPVGGREQRGRVHLVCVWLLRGPGGLLRLCGVCAGGVLRGQSDRLQPLSSRKALINTSGRELDELPVV